MTMHDTAMKYVFVRKEDGQLYFNSLATKDAIQLTCDTAMPVLSGSMIDGRFPPTSDDKHRIVKAANELVRLLPRRICDVLDDCGKNLSAVTSSPAECASVAFRIPNNDPSSREAGREQRSGCVQGILADVDDIVAGRMLSTLKMCEDDLIASRQQPSGGDDLRVQAANAKA